MMRLAFSAAVMFMMAPGQGVRVTVSLDEGSAVKDAPVVKAQVLTDSSITKVEFSIDDQIRLVLMKPPWEFKWDTIDEQEGTHTLIVNAYDASGKAGRKRVKVEVDNGLTLGVKPHAAKAIDLFGKGDYDGAYLEGRKAYRINMRDLDAIRAMAAAVGGKGDLNRAVDLLEKPVNVNNQMMGDPKDFPLSDPIALQLRGYFRMQRAEKLADPTALIKELSIIYDLGTKLQQVSIAGALKEYPASNRSEVALITRGDTLFFKGDYGEALSTYRSLQSGSSIALENRAILANLAIGRPKDAELALNSMLGAGRGNDVTRALMGLVQARAKRFEQAREQTEKAADRGSVSNLIISAYSSLCMRDYRRCFDDMAKAVAISNIPEVHILAAELFTETGDFKRATIEVLEAIKQTPANLSNYTLRGLQVAALGPGDSLKQAGPYFDFVLSKDPQQHGAKLAKALVNIEERRFTSAETAVNDVLKVEIRAADGFAVLAALHRGRKEFDKEVIAWEQAKKLDPILFKDDHTPTAKALFMRIACYRKAPVFTPAIVAKEDGG